MIAKNETKALELFLSNASTMDVSKYPYLKVLKQDIEAKFRRSGVFGEVKFLKPSRHIIEGGLSQSFIVDLEYSEVFGAPRKRKYYFLKASEEVSTRPTGVMIELIKKEIDILIRLSSIPDFEDGGASPLVHASKQYGYILMEVIPGRGVRIEDLNKFTLQEQKEAFVDLAVRYESAYDKGILPMDIKDENVILHEDIPKLVAIDWSIVIEFEKSNSRVLYDPHGATRGIAPLPYPFPRPKQQARSEREKVSIYRRYYINSYAVMLCKIYFNINPMEFDADNPYYDVDENWKLKSLDTIIYPEDSSLERARGVLMRKNVKLRDVLMQKGVDIVEYQSWCDKYLSKMLDQSGNIISDQYNLMELTKEFFNLFEN